MSALTACSKSAGELRAAYAAGKSQDELRALKQEQLKGFHSDFFLSALASHSDLDLSARLQKRTGR